MTTKTIGIKEFRANISDYAKKARTGDIRYVVMSRNKPLFELKSFEESAELEDIFSDILSAKDDIKKGKLYSQEDILAEFA